MRRLFSIARKIVSRLSGAATIATGPGAAPPADGPARLRVIFHAIAIVLFVTAQSTTAFAASYTLTEALNYLATNGSRIHQYTAQEAANILVRQSAQTFANAPRLNTTPKATLVIVVDDQAKEFWNGTINGVSIRTIMKQNHLVASFSISAYNITRMDTTSASGQLSVSNLLNMVAHDGDEVMSGGYFEGTQGGALGGWWHGNTGKLATGNYTKAQLDAAMDLHFSGNMRALRDTLGLNPAPVHSHSNSSGSDIVYPYMVAAGIRYGVSSTTTTSSSANRQANPYAPSVGYWGFWGTGGAFASNTPYVAALPGLHGSRWEIPQTLAESMDSTSVRKQTRYAMATGALMVYNFHKASDHEAVLAGVDGWKQMCDYWGALIAAGRLQCVVASDGFKQYYDNKWNDGVSWASSKFHDMDGDQKLDLWCSGTSGGLVPTAANADTALLNIGSSNSIFKYAGEPTRRLNWSNTGAANGIWGANGFVTADSSWERSNAVKIVFPPAGAGWTVIAEMRAICDTSVAGAVHPGVTPGGRATPTPSTADDDGNSDTARKYVGINFFGAVDGGNYRYTSTPDFAFLPRPHGAGLTLGPLQMSIEAFTTTNRPGSPHLFCSRNNAQRTGKREWLFVTESWDLPMQFSYLFINVYKQTTLPANEVIITDPKVRFYNRNTGEVIDAQAVSQ